MEFRMIPVEFDGPNEAHYVNSDAGVELIVSRCEDKSGFIGKLYDLFTGDLIKNFFGFAIETVKITAENHVDSHSIYKILAN